MTVMRQENADFRQVVELLKTDAALAVEVLRLANSAGGGSRYPVTSLLQAISLLGANRIVSLAATVCVGRLLKPVAKLPVMRRCWRHNLATALIATRRAEEAKVDPEKAYTFGLLSGLGRIALLVSNPQLFSHAVQRAESERMPLEIIERELYGFDHRDAGRYLVTEWKLPDEMSAVLFSGTLGTYAELAYLIRDAGVEADNLGFGVIEEVSDAPPDPLFLDIAERVNQIEQELGV
jgi:HD-like signal output (HDOD) protein